MKRPAVFFDRDGIIVKSVNGEAPTTPEELELIPEIIMVLKKTREKGYLMLVASNQPDVALGLISEETKNRMEEKFVSLLSAQGIVVDRIYYCHHDERGTNPKYSIVCDCRKPKPGLLLRGIEEFDIDKEKSFMIGDRASDVKAGIRGGVKTILFDPKREQDDFLFQHEIKPDYEIDELWQILQII
jgi:D-glycero-D-manno-heptose 1,7-bisphosphate phosphatase